MVTRLPIIEHEGKKWFLDDRLGQIRDVTNPHNYQPIPQDYKLVSGARAIGTFCKSYATHVIPEFDEYKRDALAKVCKAVMDISETNLVALSFKEHQEFNKEMNPKLKKLIDMEF